MKQKYYNEKVKPYRFQFKPKKYKDYLSRKELAVFVHRDPRTIIRAEKSGLIPIPARVTRGKLRIRLYSPQQAEEIKVFFEGRKAGRKKKNADEG